MQVEVAVPRRQAILDAALEAFVTQGYEATTIEHVRARSGASVGSIYHHFGGKEGLAAALYVEGLADYQQGYLRQLRLNREAEAGVRAVVRHHLRWVARNRELARFLDTRREAEVVVATDARVRELNRGTFAATDEWLRPHVAAGRVREVPRDLLYAVLIGPSQEFARHWLAGRVKTSIKTAERALGDAAWAALDARGG